MAGERTQQSRAEPPWKSTSFLAHGPDFLLVLRLSIKPQNPSQQVGGERMEKAGLVLPALSCALPPSCPVLAGDCLAGSQCVGHQEESYARVRTPTCSLCGPRSAIKWQRWLQRGWVGVIVPQASSSPS